MEAAMEEIRYRANSGDVVWLYSMEDRIKVLTVHDTWIYATACAVGFFRVNEFDDTIKLVDNILRDNIPVALRADVLRLMGAAYYGKGMFGQEFQILDPDRVMGPPKVYPRELSAAEECFRDSSALNS